MALHCHDVNLEAFVLIIFKTKISKCKANRLTRLDGFVKTQLNEKVRAVCLRESNKK